MEAEGVGKNYKGHVALHSLELQWCAESIPRKAERRHQSVKNPQQSPWVLIQKIFEVEVSLQLLRDI